jgi:hypothetical protein
MDSHSSKYHYHHHQHRQRLRLSVRAKKRLVGILTHTTDPTEAVLVALIGGINVKKKQRKRSKERLYGTFLR